MALDETQGIGLFGYIILFVIIVWVFGGCGFGGFNRGGCGFGYGDCNNFGFQDYKAIVDAEKSEIIRTAQTQYNIEAQASATRELMTAQNNAIATKIDYYGYQGLRDQLAEQQRENMELKNKLFIKDQLAPINSQLAHIQCNMLTKPQVNGLGVASVPIITPNLANLYGNCSCGLNQTVV